MQCRCGWAVGLGVAVACVREPVDPPGAEGTQGSGTTSQGTSTTTSGTLATSGEAAPATGDSTGSEDAIACPTARSEVDRPDDSDAPQVRVLYVVASDGADEALDVDGTLCASVLAWNGWLSAQTGGAALRLDTAAGELDIGFVRLELTDDVMRGTTAEASIETGVAYVRDRIERELTAAGHIDPNKLYAAYYGGTSEYSCGGGAWPPTLVGRVGAMYLGGQPPGASRCDSLPWGDDPADPGYLDYAMLHELVHSLGFIEVVAPGQHTGGHVYDDSIAQPQRDLMYAPREVGDPAWDIYSGLVLDPSRTQYWDHGDTARLDLRRSAFLEPLPEAATLPPGW
jgi:hypothetical protein